MTLSFDHLSTAILGAFALALFYLVLINLLSGCDALHPQNCLLVDKLWNIDRV